MKTPLVLASLTLLASACAASPPALPPKPLSPAAAKPPLVVAPPPAAPEPGPIAPVTLPAPGEPLDAPPVAGPIACDKPEARPARDCGETDVLCWQRAREEWRRYQAYRVLCSPLEPEDPIAGERVMFTLAFPPSHGPGECTHEGLEVRAEPRAGITVLHVALRVSGDCSGPEYGSPLADLGPLAAGRYRVETGTSAYDFEVRPESADPGPVPEAFALALEVARVARPGQCFGMPGPEREFEYAGFAKFAETRLYHQMKRAHPGMTDAELQAWQRAATHISVVSAGSGRFTYHYRDGQCCTISEVEGSLERLPDGSYRVGPPQVVKSESVPC